MIIIFYFILFFLIYFFFCVFQASGGKHEARAECELRAMGGARDSRLVLASARLKNGEKLRLYTLVG